MRRLCLLGILVAGTAAWAAELSIDFSTTPQGELPKGFRPLLAGEGSPGRWEVILAEVPPTLAPLSPKAPQTSVKPVLTQTVHDPTDERFPMLVYEGEEFTDFTLTARLRLLGGVQEQMAGMAFRLQDAQNFYVIRLSALGQNLRFYKVVQGTRGRPIGPSIPISTNTWHELKIECQGNQILCTLNGQLVMPALQDTSFARGRIAFWTKSDSLCQFAGVSVVYTPTTPLSVQMIEAALAKYPRVIDLRLYAPQTGSNTIRAVACKNPPDLGTPGGKAEVGAIRNADIYVGKGKQTVTVVMPVRDRNGEPAAAAQIVMDSFAGQTENNAIVRARPIVRLMETMLQSSQDPLR